MPPKWKLGFPNRRLESHSLQ
uniref:Uncharacterized protein n=1 Tax=Rhizophora mucronata TaxID=61149 RepID=A0A2P2PR75_RHIMU